MYRGGSECQNGVFWWHLYPEASAVWVLCIVSIVHPPFMNYSLSACISFIYSLPSNITILAFRENKPGCGKMATMTFILTQMRRFGSGLNRKSSHNTSPRTQALLKTNNNSITPRLRTWSRDHVNPMVWVWLLGGIKQPSISLVSSNPENPSKHIEKIKNNLLYTSTTSLSFLLL